MDIAAMRPGSSIAQPKATNPKVEPTSNQKTFLMNIGGTQAVTNNGKLTQRAQNESQLLNQGKVTPLLPSVGISTTLSPTTSWKNFFVFSIFANSPMADVSFEFVTHPC
jgi:hypothetical protein